MTESTPIADLPSGTPVPSSPPSPPSKGSKGPSPILPPLRAALAAAPSQAEAFLAHLHRCMQTPSGIDTVLLLICYGSRLSGAVLSSLARSLLRRPARELVALALSLPRGTAILFASSPGSKVAPPGAGGGSSAAQLAALLSARLNALSSLTSEARVILRLWSLLGMYFWGRRLAADLLASRKASATTEEKKEEGGESSSSSSKASRLATAANWVQFVSCVVLQVLENGAYLSSRGVLGWTPQQQGRAYVLSSRFWAVHVGIELGKLAAEGLARRRAATATTTGAAGEEKEEEERWRKQLARNLAWAPLTVHWGMEKGFVSDGFVGLLGTIPGLIQMRDLWKETAQ